MTQDIPTQTDNSKIITEPEQHGDRSTIRQTGSRSTVQRGAPDPFMTPCPAWCTQDGPHSVELMAEDRNHWGEEHPLNLSLVPAEYISDEDAYELPYLTTYLRQNVRDAEPAVNLSQGELPGWLLTLAEARELGRTLIALADEEASCR